MSPVRLGRLFRRLISTTLQLYRAQVAREEQDLLMSRFAALDLGRAGLNPAPVCGRRLLSVIRPDHNDPLERLWRLPARQEAA